MKRIALASLLLVLATVRGDAATVVATCGTLAQTYTAGTTQPITVDTNGRICA